MSDFEEQDFADDDRILIEDLDPPGTRRVGSVQRALLAFQLPHRARWWMTGGTLIGLALLVFLLLRAALPALIRKSSPSAASAAVTTPYLMIFGVSELRIYVFNGEDGSIDALRSDDGAALWHYLPPAHVEASTLASNVIYFLAYDGQQGYVYALNASSGSMLWRTSLQSSYPLWLTVIGSTVYVTTRDGLVYALRSSNGSLLWSYHAYKGGVQPPYDLFITTVDGIAYFDIQLDGEAFQARRADDGSFLWQRTVNHRQEFLASIDGRTYIKDDDGTISALRSSDGALLWLYHGLTEGNDTPPIAHGAGYFVSPYGEIDALNMSDGTQIWHYRGNVPLFATLTLSGNVLYANTVDGSIYALDARTGALLWKYTIGNALGQMAVVNGQVYVGASDGTIYDLRAGTLLWRYYIGQFACCHNDGTQLQVIGQTLYLVGYNDTLYALRASNGSLLWRHSDIDDLPVFAGGTAYVSLRGGSISALQGRTGATLWHVSFQQLNREGMFTQPGKKRRGALYHLNFL